MPDKKDEKDDAGTFGSKALDWFRQERDGTDKAIKSLRDKGGEASRIEAAVVGAQSNRELAAAIITATEIVDLSVKQLSGEIQTFTKKADQGTNRLARWTMVLAIVTAFLVAAAFVQAWVMFSAPPQVIAIPAAKP